MDGGCALRPISLAIDGLPPEYARLGKGRVYWLACAGSDQGGALARGLLADADVPFAVLVGLGRDPKPLLDAMPGDAGPARCVAWTSRDEALQAALRSLPRDLARIAGHDPALCVVLLPASLPQALDDAGLKKLCAGLSAWAQANGGTVVMLCEGAAPALAPRLLPLNRLCGGIAQLHPHLGAERLLLHYWSNDAGVVAHREFDLEWVGDRLRMRGDPGDAPVVDESDRFLVLAQAEVLEGAPALSPAWRLYEDETLLLAAAARAHSATVLFALNRNRQIDELAHTLYRLRRGRGNALGLVVREMAPCLRYADERLLLDCGASLVVPVNTPLARFLTLLETVAGHDWQGQLPDDVDAVLRAQRPPEVQGVVPATRFRALAREYVYTPQGAVQNIVLALQPVVGLRPGQALRECRIRRRGDFACSYRGQVLLFLFACRANGIEQALRNAFRLPWREMFVGYERLDAHHLDMMVPDPDVDDVVATLPAPAQASPPAVLARELSPQPIRLETAR